jgi:DNA-binding CsgD family transcriptional regulator
MRYHDPVRHAQLQKTLARRNAKILRMWSDGKNRKEIAELFNLSVNYITVLVNRKSK